MFFEQRNRRRQRNTQMTIQSCKLVCNSILIAIEVQLLHMFWVVVLWKDGKMAYSKDIRWAIVRLYYGLRFAMRRIAGVLNVSSATVRRVINRYIVYGNVSPYRIGRPPISQVLAPPQIHMLMEYVLRNPNSRVKEMIRHLTAATGSACGAESIRLVLKRHGFTYKRVSWYLKQFS